MKRRIKMAVSACFLAGSTVIKGIRRLSGLPQRPHLTILYYHGVPRARLASFERQMAMLARRARIVGADWDGAGLDQPSADHRPIVAITFDDAFESVLDYAVPVLAAHGFRCTIFVPSGCLGQAPSWAVETKADRAERVADAGRLSQLPEKTVTIGSHTVTHPRLSALSQDAALHELVKSMRDLTMLTGKAVNSLAFPYGDHDDAVIELCRSSGYKQVYTIEPLRVSAASGEFVRGRFAVDPDDGPLEFLLKLTGSYRWMLIASAVKRKLRPSPNTKVWRKRPTV